MFGDTIAVIVLFNNRTNTNVIVGMRGFGPGKSLRPMFVQKPNNKDAFSVGGGAKIGPVENFVMDVVSKFFQCLTNGSKSVALVVSEKTGDIFEKTDRSSVVFQ